MTTNYLNYKPVKSGIYANKETYYQTNFTNVLDGFDTVNYSPILPEEYNIFSEIDLSLLSRIDATQRTFVMTCLTHMKDLLLRLYKERGIICSIPKLSTSIDKNGVITFNWINSILSGYLTFEGERGNYDSYCGTIILYGEDFVQKQMAVLNPSNYRMVIERLLQTVINAL